MLYSSIYFGYVLEMRKQDFHPMVAAFQNEQMENMRRCRWYLSRDLPIIWNVRNISKIISDSRNKKYIIIYHVLCIQHHPVMRIGVTTDASTTILDSFSGLRKQTRRRPTRPCNIRPPTDIIKYCCPCPENLRTPLVWSVRVLF